MNGLQKILLWLKPRYFYKNETQAITENGNVDIDEHSDITFINYGNVPVLVNQHPLLPNPNWPSRTLGGVDSICFEGDPGTVDRTIYKVTFFPSGITNPQPYLIVDAKVYINPYGG